MQPKAALAITLDAALAQSEPLARLADRLRDSTARYQAVLPLIPPSLVGSVRAGPVDETGWSLLVDGPAAAAKLRQLKPRLEAALLEAGWAVPAVRVKILPPS